MRGWGVAAALAGALVSAGCAGPVSKLPTASPTAIATEQYRQQLAAVRAYYRDLGRIDNVAFRIRTANTRFCKDKVAAEIGLFAGTMRSLPRKYHSVAGHTLDLSWDTPRAISVAAGSPAAIAGLEPGDDVLSLNGAPVPKTGTVQWIADSVKKNGTAPITLTARRDGKQRTLTLYPVMGCSIPIALHASPIPNAYSTGDKIVIQSGLLRLAHSDADLAIVIGHELAHANLGHIRKRQENALIGEIGGAVIDGGLLLGGVYTGGAFAKYFEKAGARAYSIEFEREADYVGAYYAARAGYDVSGAENLWRAFALEVPSSISLATDHPTPPARFVYMRKTIAEIEAKERRHLPLVPEPAAPRTPVALATGL
ncbi:MAG: M48 family metallopeptidase [Pseudolabrys sp.]